MTVRQIYTRVEGTLSDSSEQFTAVLYAMVTHFNIDLHNSVLSKRWCALYHNYLKFKKFTFISSYFSSKSCNRLIAWSKTLCEMEQCQMALSMNSNEVNFEYFFNINLHLSDQTGTLLEARLTDKTAERILKVNIEQYRLLNDEELEKLKWSFLMNHFEVKLVLKKPNMLRRKLVAVIVEMRLIDIDELSKYISAF